MILLAKVSSIRVEVNFCKNLGNYESLKLGAAAELILEDKDKVATVFKQAYDMCSNEIMLQIEEFEGNVKAKGKK
jgi:hypothetical protein